VSIRVNFRNQEYKLAQLKKDQNSVKLTEKIDLTMVFFNPGLNINFF